MALSPEYIRRLQRMQANGGLVPGADYGTGGHSRPGQSSPAGYGTGGFHHHPGQPDARPGADGRDGRDGKDGADGKGGGDAKHKAANRYIEQAQTLALQAKALRAALGEKGFKAALKQKLENVNLAVRQQDDVLNEEYGARVGSLSEASADNERAAGGQTGANLTNAARERANALSEIAMNGAGESDLLRAQQMSLRNWAANQSEVQRSYKDTLTSINSSLTDLTADTKTAKINNAVQGNADKEQLWNAYRNQRSETFTQLGNTLGQMAEYYGMANEQVGSKKTRGRRKKVSDASGEAFMDAAQEAGKAWDSPGVRAKLRNWKGADAFENRTPTVNFIDTGQQMAAPEGASLRSWT